MDGHFKHLTYTSSRTIQHGPVGSFRVKLQNYFSMLYLKELMLKKTVLSTTWNLHYYLKNVLDLMVNQRFQVNLFLERLNYLHVELSTVTHFRTAIPTEQIFVSLFLAMFFVLFFFFNLKIMILIR